MLYRLHHDQMSESMWTVAFITLSGGFQDAYTYFARNKVFANAQTGNIVLMTSHFFNGEWADGVRYLIPLLSFACGVLAAEQISAHFHEARKLHWRQIVLLVEIVLLFLSGLFPESANIVSTSVVSFACAMQVEAFRKIHGNAYASTMCIGNMRSGMHHLSSFLRTGNRKQLHRSFYYFAVILIFAIGAGLGFVFEKMLGLRAIWISCPLLLTALLFMFIREEENTGEQKKGLR
jgi:uncharacterized membrane protein YoaK (UPF0700 family)